MDFEDEWPTLFEANNIKSETKKHKVNKKSCFIKRENDILVHEFTAPIESKKNNDLKYKLNHNHKDMVYSLNYFKSKFRTKAIRPFIIANDVYKYAVDYNSLDSKVKTFCKLCPLDCNMTTIVNDVRIEEMYTDFLNQYLSYENPTNSNVEIDSHEFSNKVESNSKESHSYSEKIKDTRSNNMDDELMYIRTNVLSYYFSESNLRNDHYLISIMDENGWVDIHRLLQFPRLIKTKTSLTDILTISKEIRYKSFKSSCNSNETLPDAYLELLLEHDLIRRSDMDNFRIKFLTFDNTKEYLTQPYYPPYPEYTYLYFVNFIEKKMNNNRFKGIINDVATHDDEGWKEIKPKSRRSRKSTSKNDCHNDVDADNPDYLDFEFSSKPKQGYVPGGSNIKRRQTSGKRTEKPRSRTVSNESEEELDESNIYILSLRPNATCPKTINWADVSDSDDDLQIQMNSQGKSATISHRLLAKHPSGDRHPNPDYQPRSKIQEQLRGIICEGLTEWQSTTEINRRNRHDSSSSTSSDVKVTICQDEKTFKLMQKSLQNNSIVDDIDAPVLPNNIPIERKVEVKEQKYVNAIKFPPLTEVDSTVDFDFLLEMSTLSLFNPVLYDSWNPPYTIESSLNESLNKLLSNVKYEYITNRRPEKRPSKEKCINKSNKKDISPEAPITEVVDVKPNNDFPKEIKKPTRSCKVGFYPVTKVGPAKNKEKDKTRASDNPVEEFDVGYAYEGRRSSRRHRSISGNSYNQYNDAGYAVTHGIPVPFNNHPSQLLLTENGFEIKFYKVFRKDSLADREKTGVGRSQEMNTLFRFWSFFLRDNKNKAMYNEFQRYAWEDAAKGYRYGVECLFRMYTYRLEQRQYFSEEMYRDFQMHVLKDYGMGHLYGLEKFWAFLKYSARRLELGTEIKKLLDQYKTLEDFRINFVPPQGFHSYKMEHPTVVEQEAVESGIESG